MIVANYFDGYFGVRLGGDVTSADHVGEDALAGHAEHRVACVESLANVDS